jgi:hypothetical protein
MHLCAPSALKMGGRFKNTTPVASCALGAFFYIFSDAEILWNWGVGDGEFVMVLTSAWAHSNNECLWVCWGVKEVAQDDNVDLVGNIALAATRIQKVVTRGNGQTALLVVNIASGEMARGVYTNASIHRIHCV